MMLDDSSSAFGDMIPLEKIEIPLQFLLPEFAAIEEKETEYDINRNIASIWTDYVRAYIRDHSNYLTKSDR